MTTTQSSLLLEPVGSALVEASRLLSAEPPVAESVEAALVRLCTVSFEALLAWNQQDGPPTPLPGWRGQLDELRVQAALAEMELRDAHGRGAAIAEKVLKAVDQGVATAQREVGSALQGLRTEIQRALP